MEKKMGRAKVRKIHWDKDSLITKVNRKGKKKKKSKANAITHCLPPPADWCPDSLQATATMERLPPIVLLMSVTVYTMEYP